MAPKPKPPLVVPVPPMVQEYTSDEITLSGQTAPRAVLRSALTPGGVFRVANPMGASVLFIAEVSSFSGEARVDLMMRAKSMREPLATAFIKSAGAQMLFLATFPVPAYEIDAIGTDGIKFSVTAFVGAGAPSLRVPSSNAHYVPANWATAPTEKFSPNSFYERIGGDVDTSWKLEEVTPSDANDLPDGPCEGLLVGTTGNYKITDPDGNEPTIPLVSGHVHRIAARRVWTGGAGTVWACYRRKS